MPRRVHALVSCAAATRSSSRNVVTQSKSTHIARTVVNITTSICSGGGGASGGGGGGGGGGASGGGAGGGGAQLTFTSLIVHLSEAGRPQADHSISHLRTADAALHVEVGAASAESSDGDERAYVEEKRLLGWRRRR